MKKWAMITGGAVGIGKAIASDLASQGMNVIISYRSSKKEACSLATELRSRYKVQVRAIQMDSTNEKDVIKNFNILNEENIVLSILVNNAGDYLYKNILDVEYNEWKYIIDNNLNGTFLVTQYFLKNRKSGDWARVINIGYVHSGVMMAKKMITPYYIAKSGVYQLTMALAKELAGDNITINMLSPGVMENSINVSSKADYITGSQIDIGGGFGI